MRKWSVGAKLMTLAAVALLLSIGVCSQGSFEGGTPFQQRMTNAGMVALIAAGFLFVAAIIAFVVRSMHGDDQ